MQQEMLAGGSANIGTEARSVGNNKNKNKYNIIMTNAHVQQSAIIGHSILICDSVVHTGAEAQKHQF